MSWLKYLIIAFLFIGAIPSDTYGEDIFFFPRENVTVRTNPGTAFSAEASGNGILTALFQNMLASNFDSGVCHSKSQNHPWFYLRNQKPSRPLHVASVSQHSTDGIYIHTILYYIYALEKIVI